MTQEDKFRECYKVIGSFLYFVTEYVFIEDKETSKAIPFKLWPSQVEIIPKIVSQAWLIIIKARQLGLTWLIAAYSLWLAITKPLQQVLVVSYNQDVAQEFLSRINFIQARLPDWLCPHIKRDTMEVKEFVHFDKESNEVNSIIQSLPTTPKGGQSKTPTLLVIDESALNQYFKEIYGATEPGIEAAKGRIIVISNDMKRSPGWAFTRDLFINSMKGLNIFERIFIPWWGHPKRSRELTWDENQKRKIPKFIWQQLYEKNKDEEEIIEHYPSTEMDIISVLGGSYFGKVLARHKFTQRGHVGNLVEKKGEIGFVLDPKGILEVWRYPYYLLKGWDDVYWSKRYALGSDISEGLGESYSVGYVGDRHCDEIVACMRSNRIDAYEWANLLDRLSRWYDRALTCGERTGAGQTTVKRLSELGTNQYIQLVPDSVGGGMTKKLGWGETQQSKHELCGDLKQWMRSMRGKLYDANLVDECSTFILDDMGRLGAEKGKLADCVIGAGCMVQADNFLGQKPTKVLTGESTPWYDTYKKEEVSNWAL